MSRLIRSIACASDDNWFATAQFEDRVTTWSLRERKRSCDLDDTGYDFGGSRLCMLGSDDPVVVVGSYERKTVCAYSAVDGDIFWTQEGIRDLGGCRPLYSHRDVLIHLEGNIIHRLSGQSGQIEDRFRGEKAFASLYGPLIAIDSRPFVSLWSLNENRMLWRERLESFGVLSAAFSSDTVVVAEPSHWRPDNVSHGPLRCFSLDGELLWSSPSEPGAHIINIAWNPDLAMWIGVEMVAAVHGNPRSLIQWDTNGNIVSKKPCGEGIETALFPSGRYMVSSDGQVRSLPSLELIWRFCEEQHAP